MAWINHFLHINCILFHVWDVFGEIFGHDVDCWGWVFEVHFWVFIIFLCCSLRFNCVGKYLRINRLSKKSFSLVWLKLSKIFLSVFRLSLIINLFYSILFCIIYFFIVLFHWNRSVNLLFSRITLKTSYVVSFYIACLYLTGIAQSLKIPLYLIYSIIPVYVLFVVITLLFLFIVSFIFSIFLFCFDYFS